MRLDVIYSVIQLRNSHPRPHLRALAKYLVVVHKGESKLDVILVYSLNGLLASRLANVNRLYPALHILLARQLKHRNHLRAVANMTGSNVTPVWRKVLRVDRRQRLVREADIVEGTVDLERREIIRELELVGRIGTVDDKVKSERYLLGPVGIPGRDEVLGTKLERVLFLVG